MKKRVSLWLLLVIVSCLNFYGQNQEINKEKFSKAKSDAIEKLSQTTRRAINKIETFSASNGKLTKSESIVYEVIQPDKSRFVLTEVVNGVSKKTEVIKIGAEVYGRINDGEWKNTDVRGSGVGEGMGSGGGYKTLYKYTVTKATLNQQSTQLFEEYVTVEDTYSSDRTRFIQEKVWINDKGLVLKIEYKFGYLNPVTIVTLKITEIEYNPKNLKIEAPIINKKTK